MSEYVYVVRDRNPDSGIWRVRCVCSTEELAREVVRKEKELEPNTLRSIKEHLLVSDIEEASNPATLGNDVIWESPRGVYDSNIHKKRKERRKEEGNPNE